jgi:hypothetical protein
VHRITDAIAEGLNPRIVNVEERCCGYRTRDHVGIAVCARRAQPLSGFSIAQGNWLNRNRDVAVMNREAEIGGRRTR